MDLAGAPSAARQAHASPAPSEFVIRISFVILVSSFKLFAPIRSLLAVAGNSRAAFRSHERFCRFFETRALLHPYLPYEKSIHLIHNNHSLCAWLRCAFTPESFRGCPSSGRRLSQVQHGGRTKSSPEPHDWRWKHSSWMVFTFEQH